MKTSEEWSELVQRAEEEFEKWWNLQSWELRGDKVHSGIGFVAGFEHAISLAMTEKEKPDMALKEWLISREYDIALGIEDFSELQEVFQVIIGRGPEADDAS